MSVDNRYTGVGYEPPFETPTDLAKDFMESHIEALEERIEVTLWHKGGSMKTRDYGEVDIQEGSYSNGRLALLLVKEGERIAVLTVNIPDKDLVEGEFFVKTWSENMEIAQDALSSGLFIDTGKKVQTGYVLASVWRMA